MKIELLSKESFDEYSLDYFERKHEVARVYRRIDGEYTLVETPYVEDWSLEKKRQVSRDISSDQYITYTAIEDGKIIGFIGMIRNLVGNRMILDVMQVSASYRRRGLGRELFLKGAEVASLSGASELYISANPSEETIAFYKAMGANITDNPIKDIAESEPYDLQMTCKILSLRQR
jgi:GNAT superfamily N-acetyltransferase